MTVSLSGQNTFSEETTDGIYLGLRQALYWEQKAKEQENALQLFDSLTNGMRERLDLAAKKEEDYLMIIENQRRNSEAKETMKKFEIKQVKSSNRKLTTIVGIVGVVGGFYLGTKL